MKEGSTPPARGFRQTEGSLRRIVFVQSPPVDDQIKAGLSTLERVELCLASDLDSLRTILRSQAISAVVIDPDLREGWPISIATQVEQIVPANVPIIFLCQNDLDRQQISTLLTRPNVSLLAIAAFEGQRVRMILEGEWEKQHNN